MIVYRIRQAARVAAGQFVLRISEKIAERVVGDDDASLQIENDDANTSTFHDGSEEFLDHAPDYASAAQYWRTAVYFLAASASSNAAADAEKTEASSGDLMPPEMAMAIPKSG